MVMISNLGLRFAIDEYRRRMKEGNLSLDEAKAILCDGLVSYSRSCADAARSTSHKYFAHDFELLSNQIEEDNIERKDKISFDYENYDFLRVRMPME